MRSLVALDLETTGLDPVRDAIIEIGAVRFRGARVEGQVSQLINPGRPIPPFITRLTGIDDSMVAEAPRLQDVLPALDHLVGDAPVIGHNVSFDLSFLQTRGLFSDSPAIDTFDLASVMLPAIGRYNLAAIARHLGIPVPVTHRAAADAQTTHQVFLRLVEHAQGLPQPLLEEIVALGEDIEWGGGWLFEAALEERLEPLAKPGRLKAVELLVRPAVPTGEGLRRREPAASLDIDELAAVIEPGGAFARHFPGYEHRTEQISMLKAVAQALSDSSHLMVEAGTGTGKSMAYLLPAYRWAEQNGRRVIVSTNTINLQDQLIQKDVPDLQAALGEEVRAAVLKGRSNYVCPQRLDAARRLGPRSADDMRLLAKVLVWLSAGGSGDRTEISLAGAAEAGAWSSISAESEDCSPEACQAQGAGACPYFRARQAAESAHVVIVNHALLLADIATGNRVIPAFDHLIVDEAHHLETAATRALGSRLLQGELHRVLADISGPHTGLLAQLRRDLRPMADPSTAALFLSHVQACLEQAASAHELTPRFFGAVEAFMADQREGNEVSPFGQQVRILPSSRTLPAWGQVEQAWEELRTPLQSTAVKLADISQALEDHIDAGLGQAEELVISVRTASRTLASLLGELESFIFDPDSQMIYWIELPPSGGRVSLHSAPLEVGPLMQRHLWHTKESVILTSATLTTAGTFDYLRRRLHAEDAEELAVYSPFDYENSTLLYLVNDIPEPADRQSYQRALERALVAASLASRGRLLALFTSHEQLRRTAQVISPPLADEGISVFDQSEGSSRHVLLEQFRTSDQAVLLGTRSFWEGIDVPGEALSVLVIARLPFDVPTDPIVAARAEAFESPFDEYHVPEAILRFRQGFGRLIRTRSDRGVVICLDRRILSKQYGQAFLHSLPQCTQRVAPIADLPRAISRWLGT
jgi:ATP-dependent DNA helicase DinG